MSAKRKGLGKGLDALFLDNTTADVQRESLRISEIEPNRDQPRRDFSDESLAELASSIEMYGVMQPIVVRTLSSGRYQIVAGERRWRASKLAGLSEIPVNIKELSDLEALEIALVENLQREDLNAVEEAYGYKNLQDSFSLTQEEIAKKVGKSRPVVANALRLLQLSPKVLELLVKGKISTGHARTLVSVEDKDLQEELATRIISKDLSVRQIEKLVKSIKKGEKSTEKAQKAPLSNYLKEVELSLSDATGRKIKITGSEELGALTIEFLSKDELKELAKKISKINY